MKVVISLIHGILNYVNSVIRIDIKARHQLYIKKPMKLIHLVKSPDDARTLEWSSWIDFNSNSMDKVPESEGVYKLHASMKILFIGNTRNLKQSLTQDLTNPCFTNNARFSYALTETADKVILNLLDEYRNKHDGKLPLCMQH